LAPIQRGTTPTTARTQTAPKTTNLGAETAGLFASPPSRSIRRP
jgi:hypothetical protein